MAEKSTDDVVAIAKYWYTEQRGRVVGNTKAWDDLDPEVRRNIITETGDLVSFMRESWQWDVHRGH